MEGSNERFRMPSYSPEEQVSVDKVKDILMKALDAHDLDTFSQMLMDLSERILEKHPDAKEYKLYHVLVGSGAPAYVTKFDFPGEDSVINYAKTLLSGAE